MITSLRGPKLRIFAGILAAICLVAGFYLTFFYSRGFVKNEAVIIDMELQEDAGDDEMYTPVVEHEVNGEKYTAHLSQSAPSYEIGKKITVLYDPDDPSVVHEDMSFGIYLIIVSAGILAFVAGSTVNEKKSQKKIKNLQEEQGNTRYAPSVQGEERELYFLTDLGTPKYGHRIEDKDRNVLYEAKMTKFTFTAPFGFDFIDHERGTKMPHLVGHTEESDWNSLLIDNHYTFELDGVDAFKHLKENGIDVKSSLGSGDGRLVGMNYEIFRNGIKIASAVSTSQHPHEEDAEKHKVMGAIPAQGFYRIWTKEKNLDLLFVTLLAFARSGALDDKGGSFGAIKNTLAKN